jgi:hypothetical protein
MKNKQIISPVGLKGNQILERQLSLMGIKPINENENKTNSAVELTKIGPDGNAYAIVRENHEYYIKRTNKKTGLVMEDFKYIGGLQNKKEESYPTYARAIKQLNFKFKSLAEAFNQGGDINVFEDDNLLSENARAGGFSQMEGNGFSGENNFGENEEIIKNFEKEYGEDGKSAYYATANKQGRNPETFEKEEDVELNEYEQAIEDMMARNDDEYVDYTMGNEEDPNQLANPPEELYIPEELYGKQNRIDINKNKKVDSGDLAAMRAMEESISRLDKMIDTLSEGTLKKKVVTKK